MILRIQHMRAPTGTHARTRTHLPRRPRRLVFFDARYGALFSRMAPDTLCVLVSALLTETNVVLIASHPQPLTDMFEAAQVRKLVCVSVCGVCVSECVCVSALWTLVSCPCW